MKAKNFEYVQVLANKPANAQSILYWRPFGEATISEIIEKHNLNHVEALRRLGWPDNQIEDYAQFMKLSNYELSEVDKINLGMFYKIKYVFANLSDLQTADTAVEHVKANMNQARRKYYLAQFSRPARASERNRFIPSPYLPSRPEVIDDQAKLETWLAELDGFYTSAVDGIQPPPDSGGGLSGPGGGSGGGPQGGGGGQQGQADVRNIAASPENVVQIGSWKQLFHGYSWHGTTVAGLVGGVASPRSLAEIASEVRDTAYARGLSDEDTKALARKAVLQEEFMGYVHDSVKNRLGITDELFLENLRMPLMHVTLEDEYKPVTDRMELLTVKLTEPMVRLSPKYGEICADLGLDENHSPSIVLGRPETLKKIEVLKGAVETRLINLDLPFDASDLVR